MAEEQGSRFDKGRGGFQRRSRWSDRNQSRANNNRREGGYGRRDDDRRDDGYVRRDNDRRDGGYGRRDDNRGRSFDRNNDRREGGYGRRGDDRRQGGYGRRDDNRGRGFDRNNDRREGGYGRRGDDRRQGGYGRRDDNRGRGFDRNNDRRDGGYVRRDNDRRDGGYGRRDDNRGRGFDRNNERRGGDRQRGDRMPPSHNQEQYQNYASTDEYVSPNPNEPTIPAGVSAQELDAAALRALTTLSGPNKDIVARHLVMAGQLIDLDPELAYKHALAASARAGRVDVVREASALTAYASGRYDEALREVRAVRRMRGDNSLRAVEADCERGLGRPEKAVEIIDQTETKGMELSEQVELILVSSGARADLGQNEVGLLIVDDALAVLPADTDPFLLRRLNEVKIDRLRELGRDDEADELESQLPEEIEDPDIVDISLYADADVDNKRTQLRAMSRPLVEEFDVALFDLDGTAWNGDEPIEHAADAVKEAREAGMKTVFVTNNAMRSPRQVADKLNTMDFEADPSMVMTSAMDVIALMKERIEDGSKVFAIGGDGLRVALTEAGYELVDSADDEPVAVVQGLDKDVNWALMSEGAFAIQRGARFFATNLDTTLPQERGFALGNGSLVAAIEHATGKRAFAAGKPEPGIYQRAAALVGGEKPIAVGDRLETDILGAIRAGMPAMHVLTGIHDAQAIVTAPRGQRPSFLALDIRGLQDTHPRAKHHLDNSWTCGVSQVVRIARRGGIFVDDVELAEDEIYTITLDTYRAMAAAGWDYSDENAGETPRCPKLTVVPNDDESGIVVAPIEILEDAESDEGFTSSDELLAVQADELDEALETPAFLPGEEELERLLAETEDDDEAGETQGE
ncbi:MAG: HAD-IIA family hydrolase [Schaalia turicensis]|nr:HAD-IIA family hydrolase [Schaalia turicensis]